MLINKSVKIQFWNSRKLLFIFAVKTQWSETLLLYFKKRSVLFMIVLMYIISLLLKYLILLPTRNKRLSMAVFVFHKLVRAFVEFYVLVSVSVQQQKFNNSGLRRSYSTNLFSNQCVKLYNIWVWVDYFRIIVHS